MQRGKRPSCGTSYKVSSCTSWAWLLLKAEYSSHNEPPVTLASLARYPGGGGQSEILLIAEQRTRPDRAIARCEFAHSSSSHLFLFVRGNYEEGRLDGVETLGYRAHSSRQNKLFIRQSRSHQRYLSSCAAGLYYLLFVFGAGFIPRHSSSSLDRERSRIESDPSIGPGSLLVWN
ncbi:unnamed protein product [Nezara viridula]|uniref:Uncharacterized protein n=1 Tax=Nezara viridula TaxID=85310 RepID=A0A9P0HFB6_NEZVI|nr:unnamed protein product [Nezara viridula]